MLITNEHLDGVVEMDHLEIAIWLYNLPNSIDIHANNEGAFRWSCK